MTERLNMPCFSLGIELFNKTKNMQCEAGVLQVVAKVRFVCAEVLFFSGHDIKEVAKIYFSSGMKFIACHNNIMACNCFQEADIKFNEYKKHKTIAYATVEDEVLRSEIRYAQAKVLVKLNRQSEAIKCLQSFYQNANFSLIPVALLSDIGEFTLHHGRKFLKACSKNTKVDAESASEWYRISDDIYTTYLSPSSYYI